MEADPADPATPVMVALPGTMCSPAVFGPLAAELAVEVDLDPVNWLREPGPWDIPIPAARVAAGIGERWGRPCWTARSLSR